MSRSELSAPACGVEFPQQVDTWRSGLLDRKQPADITRVTELAPKDIPPRSDPTANTMADK
jgi:hypothetical protein